MTMKKRWAAGLLGVGVIFGSFATGTSAESNVLLASVEWVNAQINPMKTKISTLETKVAQLQTEVERLKTSGGTTTTTPTTVTMPSKVYVKSTTAKLYSGAATSYRLVAQKPYGTAMNVVAQFKASTGIWYRINLGNNLYGWVIASNVSTTSVASPTSVTTKASTHIRKGAATSYAIVKTVPSGTKLKYINSFTTSNGDLWYNVETSTGLRGWMAASLGEVK
ncbi:SH3 domain-containing protein [Fictibacillus sp. b24]|uniref:SH3 domain-containing protein n=1 Tax=Fictibacillus sp. b24 TaxID=3055863 RepID=UPI0025A25BBA|nr:SH3 domain-containing protein [Fictibacillus sp. b24]MDM5315062.1 SH3 domain-containing protein [Fictibacillus sp. b24]